MASSGEPLLAGERGLVMDDVLAWHAGEFGGWQLRHFVLTSSAWVLEAMHTMVMIFADRDPYAGARAFQCDGGGAGGTDGWVPSPESIVSEFGLVCGDKYKVGLAQAVFFAGCMIGAGVFGHLSDTFFGRKGTLKTVCFLNAVFGLLTAAAPSYWTYAVLRLLTGFSTGGVGLCAFVLALEPVGPSKRGIAGMSTFYFFSAGVAAVAGIGAVFKSSWRALYVATSLPSLLFAVAVIPFISESPRWFLVRGDSATAMAIMCAIAHRNGKEMPPDIYLKLDGGGPSSGDDGDCTKDDTGSAAVAATNGAIGDVLRSPTTRLRLFLTVAINFLCSIVYYGLNLNVVNLKTNIYLSVLINAAAEMPAYALTALLLDRFGRKLLGVSTMLLSGVFCAVGSLIGDGGTARMACGVVGIFGMAATYNLLFIYTAELFPTVVRNAALGCASQAAQLGAILAPVVVILGGGVPFAVFGAAGIMGGLLVFCLPETKNKPMYETFAGMEEGESRAVQ